MAATIKWFFRKLFFCNRLWEDERDYFNYGITPFFNNLLVMVPDIEERFNMDIRALFKLLRQNYGLSNNECVLYYEIRCLYFYGGKNACYASNEYFEAELGISSGTVKRGINTLKEKGLILTRTERVERCIYQRNIYPLEDKLLIGQAEEIKRQRDDAISAQNTAQEDHIEDHSVPLQEDLFATHQGVQNDPPILDINNLRSLNLKEEVPADHFVNASVDPLLDAKDKWNSIAKRYNLQSINVLTKTRIQHLKARIKEAGGDDAFWIAVEKAIASSPFLRGQNDRKWRANFDFFMRQSSFVKALEGSYAKGSLMEPLKKPIDGAGNKSDEFVKLFFNM